MAEAAEQPPAPNRLFSRGIHTQRPSRLPGIVRDVGPVRVLLHLPLIYYLLQSGIQTSILLA